MPWAARPMLEIRRGRAEDGDAVGVTACFAAIAETGTLMLISGPESPTRNNFLPDTHIVVLHARQVVASYEDGWSRLRTRAVLTAGSPCRARSISSPARRARRYRAAHRARRARAAPAPHRADRRWRDGRSAAKSAHCGARRCATSIPAGTPVIRRRHRRRRLRARAAASGRATAPAPAPALPEGGPGSTAAAPSGCKRGAMPIEARLDLHGLTQDGRMRRSSISSPGRRDGTGAPSSSSPARAAGRRRGVLRSAVPRWLNEARCRTLVLAVAPARPQPWRRGRALCAAAPQERVRNERADPLDWAQTEDGTRRAR